MTIVERHNVEVAMRYLLAFLDPDDENCTVPADVRKQARLYLATWVAAPLVDALAAEDGGFVYDWATHIAWRALPDGTIRPVHLDRKLWVER